MFATAFRWHFVAAKDNLPFFKLSKIKGIQVRVALLFLAPQVAAPYQASIRFAKTISRPDAATAALLNHPPLGLKIGAGAGAGADSDARWGVFGGKPQICPTATSVCGNRALLGKAAKMHFDPKNQASPRFAQRFRLVAYIFSDLDAIK